MTVLRDDQSFEVLGGLDQKLGFVVDKPIVINYDFVGKVVCVKLFGSKQIAVFGEKGCTLFYEILNNCKVKETHQKACKLEPNEIVDCCDILHTGQVIVMATRDKSTPKASKMIVQKIDFQSPAEKTWVFDFRE